MSDNDFEIFGYEEAVKKLRKKIAVRTLRSWVAVAKRTAKARGETFNLIRGRYFTNARLAVIHYLHQANPNSTVQHEPSKDDRLETTFRNIESKIAAQFSSPSVWSQYKSALDTLFCKHLRSEYSQQPERRLLKVFDVRDVPVMYFNDQEFQRLKIRIRNGAIEGNRKTLGTYQTKIRRVIDLVSNNVQVRRSGKNTSTTGIEKHFDWYCSIAGKGQKAEISAARAILRAAQIFEDEVLLSEEGQKQIARVAFDRLLNSAQIYAGIRVFRAIWEKNGLRYPPFFRTKFLSSLFDWKNHPDLLDAVEKFERAVGRKGISASRLLFGALFGSNDIRSKAELKLRPAHFINSLVYVELLGASREQYQMARRFIRALTQTVEGRSILAEEQTSFAKFKSEITPRLSETTFILNNFDESKFSTCFVKGKVIWSQFLSYFDRMAKDFAYDWIQNHREYSSKWASSDQFFVLESHIKSEAFGSARPRGRKQKSETPNGLLSTKEWGRTEIEQLNKLVALAFQVYIPIRFKHEAPKIFYVEKRPANPDRNTRSCIYWNAAAVRENGEVGRFEVFINSKDRKAGTSYLAPSSDVLDSILWKYIQVTGLQFGERFFQMSASRGSRHISEILLKQFGHFVSFEAFVFEDKSERLSTHSCRSILRHLIDDFYRGHDREYVGTVALGHRPQGMNVLGQSNEADSYASDLRHSKATIETLWRIKNKDFETDEGKVIRQLKATLAVLQSDVKTGIDLSTSALENTENINFKQDVISDQIHEWTRMSQMSMSVILNVLAKNYPETFREVLEKPEVKKLTGSE